VNVANTTYGTDKSGALGFYNVRSELLWRVREMLDPDHDTGAELPPESVAPGLLADLTAFRWTMQGKKVKVESREDVISRLGRSPDKASALVLAAMEVPKRAWLSQRTARDAVIGYDPIAALESARSDGHLDYDPMRGI
jgi:hypothetical protein